jgi:signal transduction histidine kinase
MSPVRNACNWLSRQNFFHSVPAVKMTTLLKKSKSSPGREAASRALRDAGVGVVEVEDWEDAANALRNCDAALVWCHAELLDSDDSTRIAKAISTLAGGAPTFAQALSSEAARALSHELRTPLAAMAGWVHLIETGKLDEAGIKRAITKLRANIDDQVRTIERYLGTTTQEGRG